jgi:hypothetical protein
LIARPSGRAISLWDKELAHFGTNDTKAILCQKKAKKGRINGTVNKEWYRQRKRCQYRFPQWGPVGGYNGGQGWQVPLFPEAAGYRDILVLPVL